VSKLSRHQQRLLDLIAEHGPVRVVMGGPDSAVRYGCEYPGLMPDMLEKRIICYRGSLERLQAWGYVKITPEKLWASQAAVVQLIA
jgi:hypothetical protein